MMCASRQAIVASLAGRSPLGDGERPILVVGMSERVGGLNHQTAGRAGRTVVDLSKIALRAGLPHRFRPCPPGESRSRTTPGLTGTAVPVPGGPLAVRNSQALTTPPMRHRTAAAATVEQLRAPVYHRAKALLRLVGRY
jgi:hypothetical protein